MFRANRIVELNGGQADVSQNRPTRHAPPPSVMGSFQQSAHHFSTIINNHASNAINGALIDAQQRIERGEDATPLDLELIEDQTATNAAREIVETYHGDSAHFHRIQEIAAASGPPTTHTLLPQNNQVFNTRSIASSSSNHRAINNRLSDAERASNKSKRGDIVRPPGVNPEQRNRLAEAALRRQEETNVAIATKRSKESHEEEENARKKNQVQMMNVIDLTTEKLQSSGRGALLRPTPVPARLASVDMGFITNETSRQSTSTPITNTTQRNPMDAFNKTTNSTQQTRQQSFDNRDAQAEEVGNMMQRALRRSFSDALRGSGDDKNAARERVNMITNEEVRVAQLTEVFIEDCMSNNIEPDSPGMCKMLDLFRG
jgi:hypothetical protein